MNVYIMVDIEGISGIYTREQTGAQGIFFQEGRDYITAEVNACAEACKEAGVEHVYVRDAHGVGETIRWERLSSAVDCIVKGRGKYPIRFDGVDDCDGVILLGYHAMTGTEGAVLSHTMDRDHRYSINGTEVGEIAIDASFAAEHGKPIIMVSGDDKTCAEAKRFLPWVTTCEVKKGLNFEAARILAPDKAHDIIRKKTIEAIRDFENKQLYQIASPVTVSIRIPEKPEIRGVGETLTEALLTRKVISE